MRMNPEVKESETPIPPETSSEESITLPAADEMSAQWKQIGEKVYAFLAGLPEYLSDFFGEYQRPIVTLGLIFGGIVSVKLVLAVLDAVNDIPLLAPTFELVGFSYTAWFIYRYMWRASNRDELLNDIKSLKDEITGSINK